jgi:hypothetical protein
MFLGHVAIALAAKRAAPRVSLGWLVGAAQFADLLWPVLVLAGLERVAIAPGPTPFLALEFSHYPVTHSLLASLVWGLLAGGAFWWFRRDRVAALIIALLVPSHWVLDLVTHVPDLPLYPGGPEVGLGLWTSVPATIVVELGVFAGGLWSYTTLTDPSDAVGKWAMHGFVGLLTVMFLAHAFGPPPPSARAVAIVGVVGWLLPVWAWWFDAHRHPQPHGPAL